MLVLGRSGRGCTLILGGIWLTGGVLLPDHYQPAGIDLVLAAQIPICRHT